MYSFFNISPLLLGSISLVCAIPQLSFPINAQIPPLAVVAQPFSFTFSPSTFTYYMPSITFSISNNTPSWLTFDASTSTFGGTPAHSDVGNFTFTLIANDTSGTAVDDVTFVVVQDDGVTVGQDVSSQLGGLGGVDGNGGIVLNNERGFSWQFSQDTFKTNGVDIQTYYAVSAAHTPLPSWITFSPGNITFTGTAPEIFSQIAPPQYFNVTLIASTHPGFASASQTFYVVIGTHDFTIDPTIEYVNATLGNDVLYTFPLSSIQLDGQVVDRKNVSLVTADLGENGNWLTFDNSSLLLSGRPTKGDKGTTVKITVRDVFDDIVCSTINVNLFDGLFETTWPTTVNATVGQEFSFVLNDTLFAASDVQLSVTFEAEDGQNWLSYDSESRTISGTPDDGKARLVQVNIEASSASLSEKQNNSFTVQTVSTSGAPLNTSPSLSSSSSSSKKSLIIGLSVSLPITTLILLVVLIFLYCRRRKSGKLYISTESPSPPISRPYNLTTNADPPHEEEKSWGEPRQLIGMDIFTRGMSRIFTLKTSNVNTTRTKVGSQTSQEPEHRKPLSSPTIGAPQEPPKTARGSWRRSDERDWLSTGRSADAIPAISNEIFSVRLVHSSNSGPEVGSSSLAGMGIQGAAPANVYSSPEDKGKYVGKSQDNVDAPSSGSPEVDNNGHHRASIHRMFTQSSRGTNFELWEGSQISTEFSGDSFHSGNQQGGIDENGQSTRHQKQHSHKDSIDNAVEYRVSRVSGPLNPVTQNVDWDNTAPGRPRLVEIIKEKRLESSSNSIHGSEEVAFI